jgi:alpha-tubulin suppressor-like RCC1 family protein
MAGRENISLPETRRRLTLKPSLVSFRHSFRTSPADFFVKVPVKGLDDKTVIDIACGQQHSVALDSEG